ncbi:hypothetical protein EBR21_03225, partial [bacterium]|nr:hypothetical protein [bacterium]
GTNGGSTSLKLAEDSFDLASNLAAVSGDAGVGSGYLDISTKTNAGVADSRRCTMHVRPIDSTDSVVRIWTAGHCFFDPQTDKFQNSTYKAQIYYKGGYFPADVKLEGVAELAKFSTAFSSALNFPGLDTMLPGFKGQIFAALPSQTGNNCIDDEKLFVGSKIPSGSRKTVACFARSEMRGFKATLNLSAVGKTYVTEVLKILRSREQAAYAKLDAKTASQLKAYMDAHHAERRRTADLRSLAFMLNKRICDLYATNPTSTELIDPKTNMMESVAVCQTFPGLPTTIRELVISKFSDPNIIPADDNTKMKQYYDDATTNVQALKLKTAGCNTFSIDSLPSSNEAMTPCDLTNLSGTVWNRLVDQGTQPVSSGTLNDANLFGFNSDSYFAVHTNAAQTAQQKASGERGKARTIPLNPTTVLNFGYRVNNSFDNNTMLINFDSAAQYLFPTKGDSGSMFSIFGYFPAGLLSTVDGEKTSGGASVTPLPEVGSEDEATQTKSTSGC